LEEDEIGFVVEDVGFLVEEEMGFLVDEEERGLVIEEERVFVVVEVESLVVDVALACDVVADEDIVWDLLEFKMTMQRVSNLLTADETADVDEEPVYPSL
jgi:hypothetical protein